MTQPTSIQSLLSQLGLDEQLPPALAGWQALLEALPKYFANWMPLFSTDAKGQLVRWEEGGHLALGYGPEVIGQDLRQFLSSPLEQMRFSILLQEVGNSSEKTDAEMAFICANQEACILTCRFSPQHDESGHLVGIDYFGNLSGSSQDRHFVGRRRFYESLFDTLPAPIALFDSEQRYVYCNPVSIRNPEIRAWIIGKTDEEYVAYRNFDPEMAVRRNQYFKQSVSERRTVYFEETMQTPAGDTVYQLRTYTPMFNADGTLLMGIGHGLDITALKHAQQALAQLNDELERRVKERTAELEAMSRQLQHAAFHDSLTGLPNRVLFSESLERAISHSAQQGTPQYAVLFLDTDRFKGVNDTLGHPAGDELLCELALRLRRVLRTSDLVARLGGDEFAILLEPITQAEQAEQVAERIQEVVRAPIHLSSYDVTVSVSIGIVLGDRTYDSAAAVLRDADIAMYRAKAAGRDVYQVFTPKMRRETIATNLLDNELRAGLKRGELCVVYQSIVSLQTMRVTGFEALVRWQHPERGLLLPSEFIQVAEESGLLLEIDRWVLREACLQMKAWQEAHPDDPPLELSVNFSGRHFAVPGVAEHVAEVLAETGFNPQLLNLEITEGALMDKPQTIGSALEHLRSLGLQLHLDDFGTGYSSLSYLRTYPLDTLKIDRSFVMGMLQNADSAELVKTITAMAKNMKLRVVAEGIETPE